MMQVSCTFPSSFISTQPTGLGHGENKSYRFIGSRRENIWECGLYTRFSQKPDKQRQKDNNILTAIPYQLIKSCEFHFLSERSTPFYMYEPYIDREIRCDERESSMIVWSSYEWTLAIDTHVQYTINSELERSN
jgi:hypothetical protein